MISVATNKVFRILRCVRVIAAVCVAAANEWSRCLRTLLGAPLLNPFDPDIEPQVRAQFTPKVAPVPFDDSVEPLVFSDPAYEWEVLDIEISAGDGESISVPTLAFVLDHLPRRKAQDAFGGRFENWGLLHREAISDAVLDFNNGRVPRGLWRTYSGARGFIVEKGEHGCRKARVVRSVHCLRKIALRTAVMQQMVVLCKLFESVGQCGLTKGGAEVAFRCSLLAMLSAIDNQEPNDDGSDVPGKSDFFSAQQPATALTDFETAFD